MNVTSVLSPVSPLTRWFGVLRLLRPGNLLILALTVGLGALLSAGPLAFSGSAGGRVLLAAASAALVAGAGNALNDARDVHTDRVNRPARPIPSGVVTTRTAWFIWFAGAVLGLLAALVLSLPHALVAAGCLLLLYAYNAHLKKIAVVGNVAVSLLGASAVLFGALDFTLHPRVWAGAAFAFAATLARELVKDVQDLEGDRRAQARTAAVAWGAGPTALSAAMLLVLTVLATPVPFLYMNYGGIYLLGVLVTDAVLLRAAWVLLERGDFFAARASRMIKWGMVTGILSLALYWLR